RRVGRNGGPKWPPAQRKSPRPPATSRGPLKTGPSQDPPLLPFGKERRPWRGGTGRRAVRPRSACWTGIRRRSAMAAGDRNFTSSAQADDRIAIVCYHCDKPQEVSRKAQSLTCKF